MADYTKHLYLSMIPEALIASQLSPEEFGVYYALGTEKKSRGQAIFFELAPDLRVEGLPIEEGLQRCVPHEDGTPKRSLYITVYRALERVPLDAILRLYLVTQDGRVLGLDAAETCPRRHGWLASLSGDRAGPSFGRQHLRTSRVLRSDRSESINADNAAVRLFCGAAARRVGRQSGIWQRWGPPIREHRSSPAVPGRFADEAREHQDGRSGQPRDFPLSPVEDRALCGECGPDAVFPVAFSRCATKQVLSLVAFGEYVVDRSFLAAVPI